MNPESQKPTAPASAEDVLALLQKCCAPLEPQRVSLSDALGCVLREDIYAPEDQPAFDRSSVDGFAVRLDDSATEFRIVDEIRAGDWKPRELQTGEAVRIATGGALPGERLQVVMKEDVTLDDAKLRVLRRSRATNIRVRGEDARRGQTLVATGTRLSPGALALLASVGCAQPLVTRAPRGLHLATGNEIISPEQTPERGQIRDSNSILVRSFLRHWNVTPTQQRLPEDETAVRAALEKLLPGTEVLLISGGASVGEHDFTRRLLVEAGFEILVGKTNLRPGKPLIVARRGATVAFGLPGNPLAHFVCLNLFVRAALERMSGERATSFQHGQLAVALTDAANARETFWPARVEFSDGAKLTPLNWSSSGDLTALASANALLRVPPNQGEFPVGAAVEFIPTI